MPSAAQFEDRTNPMDKHVAVMVAAAGLEAAPVAAQMFGNAGREHMKLYGRHFANHTCDDAMQARQRST